MTDDNDKISPELSGFNLNLLPTLHALLEEQNVTRAAERLHLSQPAVSRALTQLREVLGDPLLIRVGQRTRLTERGQALRAPVLETLAAVSDLLLSPFDPGSARRTFCIAASDAATGLWLPDRLAGLRTEAPGIRFRFRQYRSRVHIEELRSGRVHLFLGFHGGTDPDIGNTLLFESSYVVVCRRGHPAARALTLADLGTYPHVVLSFSDDPGPGAIDRALAEHGLTRDVWIRVPYFMSTAGLVNASDALAIVPQRIADAFDPRLELAVVALPPALDIPTVPVSMVWSARDENDPGLRWLRGRVASWFTADAAR